MQHQRNVFAHADPLQKLIQILNAPRQRVGILASIGLVGETATNVIGNNNAVVLRSAAAKWR